MILQDVAVMVNSERAAAGECTDGGEVIYIYPDAEPSDIAHEMGHSLVERLYRDEIMSLCGYNEALYATMSEKFANVAQMTFKLCFEEPEKFKKILNTLIDMSAKIDKRDSSSDKLSKSQDQNKKDIKKVGDELSKITQPIEQNHTKEETK